MDVFQPVLLCSSLVTTHITIIIQDKDTNPKSFLVILREPENVINFIYHYCLEVRQLVLLIKSTPIVLMVSQIILNSTCWPAMKIAVKRETATYALMLKLACLSSALLLIYNIGLHIYIMYTIYFVSHHLIAYAHVYYSLMIISVYCGPRATNYEDAVSMHGVTFGPHTNQFISGTKSFKQEYIIHNM